MSGSASPTEDPKRVLLISKGQGLTTADRKALEAAGFVVVSVKYPADVRMISAEGPPMDANQLLRAAIQGYACIEYAPAKQQASAAAWRALCKLVEPPQEKAP